MTFGNYNLFRSNVFSVSENFVQISRLLFGATSVLVVVVKMLKSSIPALSSSFSSVRRI